jgi:hypothetical protein
VQAYSNKRSNSSNESAVGANAIAIYNSSLERPEILLINSS